MKRQPAVHLTLEHIAEIFGKMGLTSPEEKAKTFMRKAIPYNIKNRYVINGDAKSREKIARVMAVSGFEGVTPDQFNAILTHAREQAQHRVTPIRSHDTTAWRQLVEVCQMANDFSASYELPAKVGAKHFVDIGIQIMKRQYGLAKFKYHKDRIAEQYQAYDLVTNDPSPEETNRVYQYWQYYMREYGDMSYPLNDYVKYVYMVYVRMECLAIGARAEDWLKAQFEFFKIFDSIPNLKQLVAEAAQERYYAYMVKNKKKQPKQPAIEADADDFLKRYNEKLREKAGENN